MKFSNLFKTTRAWLDQVSERNLVAYLLVATTVVLSPVLFGDWLEWDDPAYVLNNPLIQELSIEGMVKMFSTLEVNGTYSPLVLLSYSFEYFLAGPDPLIFHFSNLVLHLLNTYLLFKLIHCISQEKSMAFLVALFFAIHPFHVEPVAWISSRKDLLMGFFSLISLLSYSYYISEEKSTRSRSWYALSLLTFVFALLSKSVVVLLPVALWVLSLNFDKKIQWANLHKLIPFFIISIPFAYVAWLAQSEVGAVSTNSEVWSRAPLVALNNLGRYVWNGIIPIKLSALHPYDHTASGEGYTFLSYLPGILTTLVFGIFLIVNRKISSVLFGGTLFLLTLLPVLQIIPVGDAIIAERYTYLPFIGLWICLLAVFYHSKKVSDKYSRHIGLLIIGLILYFSVRSFFYAQTWQSTKSMWENVIDNYPDDYFAYAALGDYHVVQGNTAQALQYYSDGLDKNPLSLDALNNRGLIYWKLGEYDLALEDYKKVLDIEPNYINAIINTGLIHLNADRKKEALNAFNKAIALDQKIPITYYNRAILFQKTGLTQKALNDIEQAIALNPLEMEFRFFQIDLLVAEDRFQEAEKAIESLPESMKDHPFVTEVKTIIYDQK